jgi:uncharacterized protein YprB with RNaseH-like and TPR domain
VLRLHTPYGQACSIEGPQWSAGETWLPGPSEKLLRQLQLVYGIGPLTEEKLRREGWADLPALCRHPRFGKSAGDVLKALEQGDLAALRQAGARDYELLSYFDHTDLAVIDIETAGFRGWPVFLIGFGWRENGNWHVRQYFAGGFEEEKALLHLAITFLHRFTCLVSYNGRAFDEPFVAERLTFHRLQKPTFLIHVDIYHEIRRKYREELPDFRLSTVAGHLLSRQRADDIPGSRIPELYLRYMDEGDEESIWPVIRHNEADIVDLCRLFDLLMTEAGRSAA